MIRYPRGQDGARSCPLGITCSVPLENSVLFPYNKYPLLTKLVWSGWLDIGLFLFSVFMDSISVHKDTKKNLANIQPS